MILDCYDYYLWTIGELTLPQDRSIELLREFRRLKQNQN